MSVLTRASGRNSRLFREERGGGEGGEEQVRERRAELMLEKSDSVGQNRGNRASFYCRLFHIVTQSSQLIFFIIYIYYIYNL